MNAIELRDFRNRVGLTQAQMAGRLDMSLRGYQTLEAEGPIRGVYELALRTLAAELETAAAAPATARSQGIPVRSEARRQTIGSMKEGDVFILPTGTGFLLGMIGGDDHERMLVVIGSKGTPHDAQGAGWIKAGGDHLSEVLAFKLTGARLEVERGPLGLPAPTDQPTNGSVAIDETGASWLTTSGGPRRLAFRLSDGRAGAPMGRRDYYSSWWIVWRPDGAEEDLKMFEHR